jgi:hypothetical protein
VGIANFVVLQIIMFSRACPTTNIDAIVNRIIV